MVAFSAGLCSLGVLLGGLSLAGDVGWLVVGLGSTGGSLLGGTRYLLMLFCARWGGAIGGGGGAGRWTLFLAARCGCLEDGLIGIFFSTHVLAPDLNFFISLSFLRFSLILLNRFAPL